MYFRSIGDYDLWTTDGTPDGTRRLRSGYSGSLTGVGNLLFFTSGLPGGGFGELWVTDGTTGGTRLVKHITGDSFSPPNPYSLTSFKNRLYFFADDRVHGTQLWTSDGTPEGTALCAILTPGLGGSYPGDFNEVGGTATFTTTYTDFSGSAVFTFWKTDGTGPGTSSFLSGRSLGSTVAAAARRLFWVEAAGSHAPVLTMSDGTAEGTEPVPAPPDFVEIQQPVCTRTDAFFFGRRQNEELSLWAADGSSMGTRSLGFFSDPSAAGTPGPLAAFGNRIAFFVSSATKGLGLWTSDGTPAGTRRVKLLSNRIRLGRDLVFLADDGATGCNVWRSDGTAAGTVPVGLVGAGAGAEMNVLGTARGFLVFSNSKEIWRTDGTAGGTFLLTTLASGFGMSAPGTGTREGVYFVEQSPALPAEKLWYSDGTASGTGPLHDFKADGENARIAALTTANGRLLMTVVDAISRVESLWTSDGTAASTVAVQSNAGAAGGRLPIPKPLPFRNATLFAGTDPWAGTEPWTIDGFAFAAAVRPSTLSLVAPCRVLDTRDAAGFLGGPAVAALEPRVFPVGDVCGIPWTARALAANVTVTGATSDGLLRIHPSDIGAPDATVMNFRAGQTRANNATLALSGDGEFTVRYETPTGAGQVHVIVDVVGYYE
jgi:ELWxxDGT repeat protein